MVAQHAAPPLVVFHLLGYMALELQFCSVFVSTHCMLMCT